MIHGKMEFDCVGWIKLTAERGDSDTYKGNQIENNLNALSVNVYFPFILCIVTLNNGEKLFTGLFFLSYV